MAPTDPRGGPLGTGRGTRLSALAFAATSVPLEGDLTGDGDLLGAMRVDGCDAVACCSCSSVSGSSSFL